MDVEATHPEVKLSKEAQLIVENLLKTKEGRERVLESIAHPTKVRIEILVAPIQAFRLLGDEEEVPEGWVEQVLEATCAPSIRPYSEEEIESGGPVPGRTGELFIRATELVASQLQIAIGEKLFQAFEERSTLVSEVPFSKEGMDAVLASKVFMTARTYADARKKLPWWLESEDRIEKIRTGLLGKYEEGELYVSRLFPPDTVFGCDELGGIKVKVIPVRLEREVPWETNLEVKVEVRVYWKPEVKTKKWAIAPDLRTSR